MKLPEINAVETFVAKDNLVPMHCTPYIILYLKSAPRCKQIGGVGWEFDNEGRKPFYAASSAPNAKKTSCQGLNKLACHSQGTLDKLDTDVIHVPLVLIIKSLRVKVLTNLRVIGRYVRQTLNWLLGFCSAAYADLFIFL